MEGSTTIFLLAIHKPREHLEPSLMLKSTAFLTFWKSVVRTWTEMISKYIIPRSTKSNEC